MIDLSTHRGRYNWKRRTIKELRKKLPERCLPLHVKYHEGMGLIVFPYRSPGTIDREWGLQLHRRGNVWEVCTWVTAPGSYKWQPCDPSTAVAGVLVQVFDPIELLATV